MLVGSAFHWNRRVLPWAIVGAWAVGSAFAFWYFELRLARPFTTTQLSRFETERRERSAEDWFRVHFATLPAGAAAPAATVVHVFTKNCPCNRFTDPHLANIVAAYRPRGVRFASLASSAAPDWVAATPAALVFDARGKLLYFGPYSDAAYCGGAGGLVEPVLNRALSGRTASPSSLWATGCFCSSTKTSA